MPDVDSVASRDTSRSDLSDSAIAAGKPDSTGAAVATAPAPIDTILGAACGGSEGSGTIARDLLVIVFESDAGARERAAAARSVNGKLIGQAEPGAYYLRVPPGGGEVGLRVAADRLSLLPQVRQVGSRACATPLRDTTS